MGLEAKVGKAFVGLLISAGLYFGNPNYDSKDIIQFPAIRVHEKVILDRGYRPSGITYFLGYYGMLVSGGLMAYYGRTGQFLKKNDN